MPQNIPKIIHCIWIGGGNITQVKSLNGIKTWLTTQHDYEVWVWWDDSHVFSMHGVRDAIRESGLRRLYEMERGPRAQPSARGRDIRNLQFMTEVLKIDARTLQNLTARSKVQAFQEDFHRYRQERRLQSDQKTVLALYLIDRSQNAFLPLRQLSAQSGGRLKLCNVRSHEFLPTRIGGRKQWLNRDLYDEEMASRGIFPAAASDILRYEILYNYGGIYMDVDLELRASLGTLTVERDLALCAYEDAKGPPRRPTANLQFQQATAATHGGQPLYAMNNIVATHAKSGFAAMLRKAIRTAYDNMKLGDSRNAAVGGGVLRDYWERVINKATVDITGPNLVRDLQYLRYRGFSADEIPTVTMLRLVWALAAHRDLWDDESDDVRQAMDTADELLYVAFPRFAKVWRDDDPVYAGFFTWVYHHTYFPMHKVNWKTDAAQQSDTKAAAGQRM